MTVRICIFPLIKLITIWMILSTSIIYGQTDDIDELEFDYFMNSCETGDVDYVVKKVMEYPALAYSIYKNTGTSCLMQSAKSGTGAAMEITKFLLRNGADVNSRAKYKDNNRMPVLAWHVLSGNVNVVNYLIDNGADINAEFDGFELVLNKENEFTLTEKNVVFTVLDLLDFLLSESTQGWLKDTLELPIDSFSSGTSSHKLTKSILESKGGKYFKEKINYHGEL